MGSRELGVMRPDVVTGLADDFKVPNHRVLSHFVLQKRQLVKVFGVPLDTFNGLRDVVQVIGQPLPVAAHMGTASARTVARNLSGSAFGVNTSTGKPRS